MAYWTVCTQSRSRNGVLDCATALLGEGAGFLVAEAGFFAGGIMNSLADFPGRLTLVRSEQRQRSINRTVQDHHGLRDIGAAGLLLSSLRSITKYSNLLTA
jgi:hypothetical protein